MSDKSRRKLLKTIAAGSGAIVAGKSLPDSWSRPVVDSVILPVHALTSSGNFSDFLNLASLDLGDTMLATLIPDAQAGGGSASPRDILCIEVMAGAFRFGLLAGRLGDIEAIYRQNGGTVGGDILWTGGGDVCGGADVPEDVGLKVKMVDGVGAHYELWETTRKEPLKTGILPMGTCPWDVATTECPSISDIRLKTNIEALSVSRKGYDLYKFQYIDENDENTYVGVMAQDIIARNPEAVVQNEAGFYMVRYAQLGLKMVSLKQWESEGPDSVELMH